MNRIVRDHYPIERLPSDLRDSLDSGAHARVTIEVESLPEPAHRKTFDELFALLEKVRAEAPIGDDPVARIRALRDEWDR